MLPGDGIVDLFHQRLVATLNDVLHHNVKYQALELVGAEHWHTACARFVDPSGTTIFAIPIRLVSLVFGTGIAMHRASARTTTEREQVAVEGRHRRRLTLVRRQLHGLDAAEEFLRDQRPAGFDPHRLFAITIGVFLEFVVAFTPAQDASIDPVKNPLADLLDSRDCPGAGGHRAWLMDKLTRLGILAL
nr:hypothetical protein [Candidatus Chloroploca mongolica]